MRWLLVFALVGCSRAPQAPDLSSIAGIWESPRAFSHAQIVISDGAVRWDSDCDEIKADGTCTGTFADNTLTLSAEMGWGETKHQVFHLVERHGREYLLTEGHMQFLQQEPEDAERDMFCHDLWYGLRRRLSKDAILERIASAEDEMERVGLVEEYSWHGLDLADVDHLTNIALKDDSDRVYHTVLDALYVGGEADGVDDLVKQACAAAFDRIKRVRPDDGPSCPAPGG